MDVNLTQLQHSPERVKLLKMDDAFRALVRGLCVSFYYCLMKVRLADQSVITYDVVIRC